LYISIYFSAPVFCQRCIVKIDGSILDGRGGNVQNMGDCWEIQQNQSPTIHNTFHTRISLCFHDHLAPSLAFATISPLVQYIAKTLKNTRIAFVSNQTIGYLGHKRTFSTIESPKSKGPVLIQWRQCRQFHRVDDHIMV